MTSPRTAQLVEAGMWLRLSGDHEGAKRLFDQALKLDPDNARARQLIDSSTENTVPEVPVVSEPSNPFTPAPTSTAMDLDWGSATGFSPTPIPFIPPVEFRSPAPTNSSPPLKDDLELPIELDIESLPPVESDDLSSTTLVFGRGGASQDLPPPAPTVPEHWGAGGSPLPTMLFEESSVPEAAEEVPWGAPLFDEQPPGLDTMQFARSDPATAPPFAEASPTANTMQFAQPRPPPADENWADLMAPAAPPSEPRFAVDATSAWDHRSNPGIKLSELDSGPGAALDLVRADRPSASPPVGNSKLDEVKTLVRGAKDLLGLDDHTGAMDLILKAQDLAPNDPEVHALRTRSESTLEAMFESKLGKLSSAPRVKLKDDEIIWLNLDHRAGFVLAQIDGQVTFEDLFSVSGMSRLDTARILAQLLEEGVITP